MSRLKRSSKKSRVVGLRFQSKGKPTVIGLGTIDETVLQREAVRITGSPKLATAWMERSNPLLGNITPLEAVKRNKGRDALSILLNIAGV